MKKILFWMCGLCIVGVLAYFLSRPASPGPELYYADFLSEDTAAVVSLYDMEGVSEVFPGTPTGRFLSQPVMHAMMRELGGTDEELEQYDTFYNAVADIMTSPLLRQIFGDDEAIALCPPDQEGLRDNPDRELHNALLAFGTSSSAGWIGRFARMVMRKDVRNVTIQGLDMTRIRLDDNEVLYGYDNQGIVLLAYNPQRIVNAIQQKKAGKSLANSQAFTATAAFWKKEGKQGRVYARSYLNAMRLQELVSVFAHQKTPNMADAVAKKLAGLTSIGGLIFATQDELRLRMKGIKGVKRMKGGRDPASLSGKAQTGTSLSGAEDLASPLLQANTLLHYRLAHFDKAFFRNVLASATTEQQYSELEKSVQDEAGFSLDNFLEAVGPRAGISVHEIVNAGIFPFPLPKTVLAIQVRNRKAVGRALKKFRETLKKQGVADERQDKVQGHRLYYWTVMPVEITHLAVVLTDTMLYIANGENQLRSLLEEQQAPEPLAENMVKELGEAAGTCVATANSSAFLVRPQRLAVQLVPVVDWLTDMMAANGAGSGKKIQEEVLTLMRSFDVLAACSKVTETQVSGEIILKPLPAGDQEKK